MGLMVIKTKSTALFVKNKTIKKFCPAVDTYSLLWPWSQRAMLTPPHCSPETRPNTVLSSETTWDPSKETVEEFWVRK
jgi:hypothetical protein